MNKEILESYRKVFDELKTQFNEIEQRIKEEATKDVSSFMFQNKFDESQAAVGHLKELLDNITFDIDFSTIEHSITSYNHQMKVLKSGTEEFFIPTLTPNKTQEVTKKVSNEIFNNSIVNKKQDNGSQSFIDFVQEKIPNHKFTVVNVAENVLELEKNKRYYHMTLIDKNPVKEGFISKLEEMNEKKNIGFICENDESMKAAQKITTEWVESSPEYKTKFLTIHFTTKKRLSENGGELFETYSF